jgi:calcium-dependent protein kinase
MNTVVGSPYYVAPEVLRGQYGKECDVWSAGVILYILLSGCFPFSGQTNPEIFRSVIAGTYNTTKGLWTQISADAKDLIRKMMTINPADRITAEEALQHPWFSNQIHDELKLDPGIIHQLRKYRAKSKMQKEAMSVMVKYMDFNELGELRQIFHKLDHNGTGTITSAELH